MTPTRIGAQEGFSVFCHVGDVSDSGTQRHRRCTKGDGGFDDGNNDEYLLPPPLLPESMLVARIAGDGGAEGLQGLSPGPGQGPYAAKFRSPCPHSQQSAMVVDQSAGSVFDATSPFWDGVNGDTSMMSPSAVSIRTAYSLCLGEEGEEADMRKVGPSWDEGREEKMGKEDAGDEEKEKGCGENHEVEEVEDEEEENGPDDDEENDEGGRQRQAFCLLDEERGKGGDGGGGGGDAAGADLGQDSSPQRGSATRYKNRRGWLKHSKSCWSCLTVVKTFSCSRNKWLRPPPLVPLVWWGPTKHFTTMYST